MSDQFEDSDITPFYEISEVYPPDLSIPDENQPLDDGMDDSYDEGFKDSLRHTVQLIKCLLSPNKETHMHGKIMWKVLSSGEQCGIILALTFMDDSLPDAIHDYCLILLKKYFSAPPKNDQEKHNKKIQGHVLFKRFFNLIPYVSSTQSFYICHLLSIICVLNHDQHSQFYLQIIFKNIFDRNIEDHHRYFILLKKIIKIADIKLHPTLLPNFAHYIPQLFKFLTDETITFHLKAYTAATLNTFLFHLLEDQFMYESLIRVFLQAVINNYDAIIDELTFHSYEIYPNHMIKLLKFLQLVHRKLELNFVLSKKDQMYLKISKVFVNTEIHNEYLINSLSSDQLVSLRFLCSKLLVFLTSLISFGSTPREAEYISTIAMPFFNLLCIENNEITETVLTEHGPSLTSDSDESQSDEGSKGGLGCYEDNIEITNIQSLRPIFLNFLNKLPSQMYETVLLKFYSLIVSVLGRPDDVPRQKSHRLQKTFEVCLWLISKTSSSYFSMRSTDASLYDHLIQVVKSYLDFQSNDLLTWQGLMAYIALCTINPSYFDPRICDEISIVMSNDEHPLFVITFCCEALRRMAGILKFHTNLNDHYKKLIGNLCDNVALQYKKRDDICDKFKIHFIKTLEQLLVSSEHFLIEHLNNFFVLIFEMLKDSTTHELSGAIVETFNAISTYACVGNAFLNQIYPYLIEALKQQYSSNSLITNPALFDIVQTVIKLSKGLFSIEEITYLYSLVFYFILRVDDDETLIGAVRCTCLCLFQYSNYFTISDVSDGSLSSYSVFTMLLKLNESTEVSQSYDLFELTRITFFHLPNVVSSKFFLRLLLKICSKAQRNCETKQKQFDILTICVYINHFPTQTWDYLRKLPGVYSNWALQDLCEDWYEIHLAIKYDHFVYRLISAYAALNLLSICVYNRDSQLLTLTLGLEPTSNTTEINLFFILLSIILSEIRTISKFSLDFDTPENFYTPFWNSYCGFINSESLNGKITNFLRQVPQSLLESSLQFISDEDALVLKSIVNI